MTDYLNGFPVSGPHNSFQLHNLLERPAQFKVSAMGDFSTHGFDLSFQVSRLLNVPWSFPQSGEAFHEFAQWRLWESDVVEVFLQWRLHPEDFSAPYLELNFSPTGGGFSLVVYRPRVVSATPIKRFFKAQHQFSIADNHELWVCKAKGNWPQLICAQGQLWGSYHACLGPAPYREFFAPYSPPGKGPDFHRPQFFLPFKLAN